MNVGQRIKERRKQLKMSVDYIAEKLNVDRSTVYRYESSEIEKFPVHVIKPLSKILKVSPAYLMGWEVIKSDQLSTDYPFYPIGVSAGLPIEIDAINELDMETISIPDNLMGKWAGNEDVYVMRANGDSMNRVFSHGSLLAVKQIDASQLKDGDIVVYSDGGDYAVKKFYQRDDEIIFKPDSTDVMFSEYRTSTNNEYLKIHGKVVLYIVELD